jgi:hypothetical protein
MTTTILPSISRVLTTPEAHAILRDAWLGGKNRNDPHARWVPPGSHETGWLLVEMPLDWVQPNDAGELYDGTVNPERARAYADGAPIDTPVYLVYGARSVRSGRTHAAVMDGGHRTSAARMRGEPTLPAIMRRQDLELLHDVRAKPTPCRSAGDITPSCGLAV